MSKILDDLARSQETLVRAHEAIGRLGASHRTYKFVAISRAIILAYFAGLFGLNWRVLAKSREKSCTCFPTRFNSHWKWVFRS